MAPNPTILIADHRDHSLQALAGAWQTQGARLLSSHNLRQSLELLAKEQPELLVFRPFSASSLVEFQALDRARLASKTALLVVLPGAEASTQPWLRLIESSSGGPLDWLQEGAAIADFRLRMNLLLQQVERELELQDLRHRSSHDERTLLLRPMAFEARLAEHASAAQRHRFELTLVLLDLDDFRTINKRFDHTVGDRVIASVGETVRSNLRAEDVAGRLGGDEFGVLLPYTARHAAEPVLARLLEGLRSLSGPGSSAAGRLQVSASAGAHTLGLEEQGGAEALRHKAERALRAAKVAGGDRVVFFADLPAEPS